MPSAIQPSQPSDVLFFEEERDYSRQEVTVILGQNIKTGTVLGKITTSGKYKILAPTAADGSQTAIAVALYDVDATAGDTAGVVLKRLGAVKDAGLIYPTGITAAQKTTAINDLESAGILVRASA